MFKFHRPTTPILPTEDGIVSAKTLPADRETSRIEYETATFGLG